MNVMPLLIEGRGSDATQAPLVDGSVVTPEYFQLLRVTLLRGRLFTNFDTDSKPAVAVVNDAMARAFWPNADPIGARVKLSSSATAWTTIVGVIADARTDTLAGATVPQIYASAYQKPAKHLAIFLRGPRDTSATVEGVRAAVESVDPSLPVFGAELLTDTVSASLDARRFATEMIGVFALTALMLAALGIYGVVSYMVVERTQEIGIRVALGARQHTIMCLVVGHGLTLTTIGALVGLVFAAIVARLMAAAMPGIRQSDPVMFTAVASTLIAVACCACYIPARRALRIDPIAAVKGDA
jgi:putative ABC transport system permease protein